MALKNDVTIELSDGQREYLAEMLKKFDLPDEGKAIRCLINHARENAELEEDMFGEFRCLDC